MIAQNGNEYTTLDSEVTCYVKIGSSGDKDKLRAIYINGEKTKSVDANHALNIENPSNGDKFAMLVLKHFSPYAIYQAKSDGTRVLPTSSNSSTAIQDSANDISVANNFATGESVEYVYRLGLWAASVIALVRIVGKEKV